MRKDTRNVSAQILSTSTVSPSVVSVQLFATAWTVAHQVPLKLKIMSKPNATLVFCSKIFTGNVQNMKNGAKAEKISFLLFLKIVSNSQAVLKERTFKY